MLTFKLVLVRLSVSKGCLLEISHLPRCRYSNTQTSVFISPSYVRVCGSILFLTRIPTLAEYLGSVQFDSGCVLFGLNLIRVNDSDLLRGHQSEHFVALVHRFFYWLMVLVRLFSVNPVLKLEIYRTKCSKYD